MSYIQVCGGRSLTLHPTCAAYSVLYFWSHWRECVVSFWGRGRHYCPFLSISCCLCVFVKINKLVSMLLIGMNTRLL